MLPSGSRLVFGSLGVRDCISSSRMVFAISLRLQTASSVMGFSNEDLLHLSVMYAQAAENWSHTMMKVLNKNESCQASLPDFRKQIDAYWQYGHAASSQIVTSAAVFVLLISIIRFSIELGLSKQAFSSVLQDICPSWMLATAEGYTFWMPISELVPVIALIILAFLLHKSIARSSCWGMFKCIITGTIISYALVAAYWASESKLLKLPLLLNGIRGNIIPQIIYVLGCAQLSSLALLRFLGEGKTSNFEESVVTKAVAMLSAWSSTVILLSGRQGPLVALASIVGGAFSSLDLLSWLYYT
ncbi:hypothetical protein U1Q18_045678 [Sarracenia purpurea var. burkii]